MKPNNGIVSSDIQNMIFTIRGVQIMLDRDLASVYGVETKVLNQAVKRNIDRFPLEFRFQLTESEHEELVTNYDRFNLRSQIVTSSGHGGRRYLPYVFTEPALRLRSYLFTFSPSHDPLLPFHLFTTPHPFHDSYLKIVAFVN